MIRLVKGTLAALMVLALIQLAAAQIVISEVDPATGTIELHNVGMEAADASGHILCNRPAYAPVGDLEVVSGEMMIPADGLLVIVWDAVAAADAELGIYVDNQFGSAESLVSYLQWGSAGHGRESVAEAAGLGCRSDDRHDRHGHGRGPDRHLESRCAYPRRTRRRRHVATASPLKTMRPPNGPHLFLVPIPQRKPGA